MAHPHIHAKSSVRRFGGKVEDYIEIHDWFDGTKELEPTFRHRALRHHTHGIFECERVFGRVIVNSDGKEVPVRVIPGSSTSWRTSPGSSQPSMTGSRASHRRSGCNPTPPTNVDSKTRSKTSDPALNTEKRKTPL